MVLAELTEHASSPTFNVFAVTLVAAVLPAFSAFRFLISFVF
jgi:hypothetical protein